MSLCRSALRGLSEERRTHKKRAVTKELDNCRRCGQASHRNLSNALNDIDSTTWLAKRMHSDDCGAAVGKHALVVFTGTVDFKCDACHKKFMASSSTSLPHLGAWLIKGNGHRTKCVTKLRGLEVDHQWTGHGTRHERATSWSY